MAIKLIDIEAGQPFASPSDAERYSAVWALVKLDGVPVGYAKVKPPFSEDRLSRAVRKTCGVELLRRRLYRDVIGNPAAWGEEPPPSNGAIRNLPSISVIVCTRDRPRSLSAALKSLQSLDYLRYEVIIVDNCPSTGETKDVASLYPFRYIIEPKPGLDRARNRGIAESRGDITAFIDDDAVADPEWLSAIAAGFDDPDVMCVTGLVLPLELETRAQVIFERDYWGFGRGFQRRWFCLPSAWRYAAYWPSIFGTGCNMAFRKEFFSSAGTFDPSLDVGMPAGGGGDLDMFHRVIRSGCSVAYRPEAVVRHRHRQTMKELRAQLRANGRAFTALFAKWWLTEPESRPVLRRLTPVWYMKCFGAPVLRRTMGRSRMPLSLILTEAIGSLQGPKAYLESVRRSRELDTGEPEEVFASAY